MQRIFLGWDRPALHSGAERLFDAYGGRTTADLSVVVLVLPGARAGRRLKEILVETATERSIRLVPPRIVTLGGLPELLYEAERPLADPIVARRAWAEALREAAVEVREALFPLPPPEGDLRGWERLAAEVAKLHTEVGGAGRRFADVPSVCRSGALFFDDHRRWEALAGIQDRYAAILNEVGRVDRELARIDALAGERIRAEGELWLVGVAEMPVITRRLLERAGDETRILVHAPASESEAFDRFGCVRPEAWAEREIEFPDDTLRIADRPGDQADVLLSEIAALGDRYSPEDVVVAMPDREVTPYVEQRLEEWSLPTRSAAGTPLSRTPAYRFLAAIAEMLRSGRRWESFAALLRHPDLGDWLQRGEGVGSKAVRVERAIAQADRFHAETLPLRMPDPEGDVAMERKLARYPELARARARIDRLLALLGGGRPYPRERPLSKWPKAVFELLAAIHGERTLSRDRPAERRLLDTLSILRRAALSLARLPERLDPRCDAATAIDLLLEAARGDAVPDDPDRASVELLGWLELPLDDAPVAFVTGMNEPFLPQSVTADVFLPDRLRTVLGILDNHTRYARDAFHLTAILHDRDRVRVVSGRVTADGDPLHPSRLMLAVRGAELARRVQWFAAGGATPATVVPPGRAAAERSGFLLPPEPELVRDPPASIPVTAFREILENPYLWSLSAEYRLRGHGDDAREMDGLVFGGVAHDILRAFGLSEAGRSTDEATVAAALDSSLDQVSKVRFGRGPLLPAVRIQLHHLRLRLRAFARWQAAWAAEGWRIRYVEGRATEAGRDEGDGEGKGDPIRAVPFDVDGEPILLTGRIDRIDHHPERGEWVVFDYKTSDRGDPPERTHLRGREAAWVDLQLPLYRNLACDPCPEGRTLLPADARDRIRLGYILLPRDLEATGAAVAGWTPEELETAEETARNAVRKLRVGRFAAADGRLPRWLDPGLTALLGGRQLVAALAEEEDG